MIIDIKIEVKLLSQRPQQAQRREIARHSLAPVQLQEALLSGHWRRANLAGGSECGSLRDLEAFISPQLAASDQGALAQSIHLKGLQLPLYICAQLYFPSFSIINTKCNLAFEMFVGFFIFFYFFICLILCNCLPLRCCLFFFFFQYSSCQVINQLA